MSKLQDQKKLIVEEIKSKLKNVQAFVLVDYKGINVAQDTELRSAFRDAEVDYKVYKNRLLKIALNELGYTQFNEHLVGPTAIALIDSEEVFQPAKIVKEKALQFKKLKMKCGMVEGGFLDEVECLKLASMPSKLGLISQILGLLQSPMAGLARALKAIAEK